MKSISALALFSFALITECLGAQSERSRQRSGPIRSVPVAADIKRDTDFDCPEEFGYYPHPNDCTLYYVCVFGGALLESCTGGLMYSHELQTCDWPRNVGCDGTSAAAGEELVRISERERDPPPAPPPPRRNPPPPPPPRAQPNPVVTSRGQPKFNRDEYEKQQQLYAEVDDLPPVEEIESDRQQRVYRGQPSTIGQVQKDRDGYGSQVVSSRTLNANIIPASVPQNSGKLGSFSFGTQVDERRTATATPAPQTYSDNNDTVTDSNSDRQSDIATNEIDTKFEIQKPLSRKKRDLNETSIANEGNNTKIENISDRNDREFAFIEVDPEDHKMEDEEEEAESSLDDIERGKRQVRYYLQKGHKVPEKTWHNSKPIRFVDLQQFNYNPNTYNAKYQQQFNDLNGNNYHDDTRKPHPNDSNLYSSANPFASYQIQQNVNSQSLKNFKPSFPDPFARPPHAPMNVATQIITKSPPISTLINNNENAFVFKNNESPFSALAGGFYNNIPSHNTGNNQQSQNNNQYSYQPTSVTYRPGHNYQVAHSDSSLLPSTHVTAKPVKITSTPRTRYRAQSAENVSNESHKGQNIVHQNKQKIQEPSNHRPESPDEEYDDEEDEQEEESSEAENESFEHDFPDPPYEFTHPSNKYAEIENPFASPNFDFDAFLAKLRGDTTIAVTSPRTVVKNNPNKAVKIVIGPNSTPPNHISGRPSQSYSSMSTPRPFSSPSGPDGITSPEENNYKSPSSTENSQQFLNNYNSPSSTENSQKFHKNYNSPSSTENSQKFHSNYNSPSSTENTQKFLKLIQQSFAQQQQQQQSLNQNIYSSRPQQNAGIPVDAIRPKLKPPNFKDDRQLPIIYNFERQLISTSKPSFEKLKDVNNQIFTVTQKPYVFVTATGTPVVLSTPKQQFIVKPDKIVSLQPHFFATGKPYMVSSIKPHNAYAIFKQSTAKPLTTLANEQLSALQNYWNNPSTEFYLQSTTRPKTTADIPKLESLFAQAIRDSKTSSKGQITTTTNAPLKKRPIPKPSPEMNDYYYDDDEQYYYEPPVKPKYMPSSEVKPQRPPMAQNYQEYDDDESEDNPVPNQPVRTQFRRPTKYNSHNPESATKNHNDVSVVTKAPLKEQNKFVNGKISIPVLVDYGTPAPNVLMRPEISNYNVMHYPRNRTYFFRKPTPEPGPFTLRPPKYLNQTTLRPYTVRHRLAKPTTVKDMTTQSDDNKQTRGRMRHHNIVAQMKLTTPRDSQKQETRITKTRHDDKTNSLEPTESVTPSSYASPRPKMLYNGTQAYSPDQYDPYYAVYDEDGELYKDPDYVQQYNVASLRPAVQQTYRGTPPPARRPVETYTPRPSQEDYDDAALIHGQINNNQNQYQTPIRHSTRGEGNELGYDNNPSSVKTTLFEATSISTTPSTTSTSTTQRATIAPFTEAMTPSRYTPRSPTDENPNRDPDSSSESPSDGSALPIPSSPSPKINFSSLAKPFEKTDNSFRLQETLSSTERLTSEHIPRVNNHNLNRPTVVLTSSKEDNKKGVSLTTGFSIRRNPTNSNNPYTLTVLTRPFDHFNKSHLTFRPQSKGTGRYFNDKNDAREISIESQEDSFVNSQERPIDISDRRKDSSPEIVSELEDIPIYLGSSKPKTVLKPNIKLVPTPTTGTTKYYLKQVINKRPAPFTTTKEQNRDPTEKAINKDTLIETALQNSHASAYLQSQINTTKSTEAPKWNQYKSDDREKSTVSPYRALDNLQNHYNKQKDRQEYTTSTAATTRYSTTVPPKDLIRQHVTDDKITSKPAYYSYRILDEETPDHTTEVLSGTVKNLIKAFFDNFSITPKPQPPPEIYSSTTPVILSTSQSNEKVVNIGFQKKLTKYREEQPFRNNVQRLQILTESGVNRFISSSVPTFQLSQKDTEKPREFPSTTTMASAPNTDAPLVFAKPQTTPLSFRENPQLSSYSVPIGGNLQSKFNNLVTGKPDVSSTTPQTIIDSSQKFHKLINDENSQQNNRKKYAYHNNFDNEVTKPTNVELTNQTEVEWNRPNEVATTTSTTKSTTVKTESTSTTTKSISFPTRPSRVNPAIKLAATNLGGGRRSYQSSSKCSSDNSLQANPKCNEIKYQRPSSTRGRGSAHYSTSSQSEVPQQQTANRGTPPTRSRPTLKPSTAVVTNNNPVVDIYASPPKRPAPVYPQPTPDKTAAKCRKDVCLLPDCYCGGKDIPGDLPVESVPQIVLLTFDDSVNDLNKGLYADLFEKGRVNPNGCPITATFYVSHEWTDYSQVQNLYSAGHEMASHTISHSFGEQFSQKKWNREVGGQREILAAYGGVKLEDVRGMRAPFLSVGGNKMFKMLYDSNFTYDSSLPVYENRPPSWPYTLDYKLFHDCMIPPCPTKSYPGVWEVPMVMWQDLNGGRCSMGDACANPPEAEGVYKMLLKNFDRHYTTNRAPFGLFYHAAWFTQPHHKEGFIMFLDFINQMNDVWIVTNWQALQWVRDPTPISRLNNFQPFQCNYQDRPKKCNNPKVCNLWHKSGVRYMRTCQPCPEVYPWTGKTGIRSSRIDNEIDE